jgi:hypothetical protein
MIGDSSAIESDGEDEARWESDAGDLDDNDWRLRCAGIEKFETWELHNLYGEVELGLSRNWMFDTLGLVVVRLVPLAVRVPSSSWRNA